MKQRQDEYGHATGIFKPGTSQKVAIGAATAQSSAFGSATRAVTLHATSACFVAFGSNPTAVADTTHFLAAGERASFMVDGGDKVAVIQSSASGSLYVTELA